MKVYVSCHHPDPANAVADALEAAGHTVVSDWHRSDDPPPDRDDGEAWAVKAAANFTRILGCEMLVIVAGPERYPGGKFVEAGFALGLNKDVITVGRVENGMLFHPTVEHADDAEALLKLL